MPTPDGIERFLKKRGIPVRNVYEDGQGFVVVVKGKGREALEFLGSSAEEMPFTIQEINNSAWGIVLWRARLLVLSLSKGLVMRCLRKL